jgi:hypothetical protein
MVFLDIVPLIVSFPEMESGPRPALGSFSELVKLNMHPRVRGDCPTALTSESWKFEGSPIDHAGWAADRKNPLRFSGIRCLRCQVSEQRSQLGSWKSESLIFSDGIDAYVR